MARFRFLHAADLHIDSPLVGLARKSQDLASRIDNASRRAFDNLISLAIDEECAFVVIAGDLFDGQLREFRTGLYFVDRILGGHPKPAIGGHLKTGQRDS